jgi:hypothetical protein
MVLTGAAIWSITARRDEMSAGRGEPGTTSGMGRDRPRNPAWLDQKSGCRKPS